MRRLTRTKDRIFLGVAGGLAEYLHIDKVLVRVLWVILCFPLPLAVLVYLIMGIVVPEEGSQDYIDVTPGEEGAPRRRLTRSKPDMIAGVCAGIADYFHADPTIVRLTFVVGAFMSFGLVVLAYIILAIVLPAPETAG